MNFVLFRYPSPRKRRTLSSLLTAYDSTQRAKELVGATKRIQHHETSSKVSSCQWLDGEPKLRQFCDAPVKQGSSYCPDHHARCWVKATETRTESCDQCRAPSHSPMTSIMPGKRLSSAVVEKIREKFPGKYCFKCRGIIVANFSEAENA